MSTIGGAVVWCHERFSPFGVSSTCKNFAKMRRTNFFPTRRHRLGAFAKALIFAGQTVSLVILLYLMTLCNTSSNGPTTTRKTCSGTTLSITGADGADIFSVL